jgi:CBS domain-containing protein
MSTVRDIISFKGAKVWSVPHDATVLQAAQLMNEHKIGAVLVTDRDRIVGIFSERDVLRRVVSEQRDPGGTRVGQVMTTDVVCGTPATTVEEARAVMRDRRIRHLPVLDVNGTLLGLVSIGDLNAHQLASQEQTIHFLQEYLHGRV